MSMLGVYGIRQCDSCRKALKWLDGQEVPYRFHDLRVDGLAPAQLGRWLGSPFADRLVNRRSTTWRSLCDAEKASSGTALRDLLLAHPTLLKRPVFERQGTVLAVGFEPGSLQAALSAQH